MTQAHTKAKTVTFDEFVAWYPENSVHKYELHNGVIVEMPLGTGDHSAVAGFIAGVVFLVDSAATIALPRAERVHS